MQPRDRESGPVGAKVLAPGWSTFADGQMSWGDVAFDADLVANVLGDLAGAPALYAGDVELGKSASGRRRFGRRTTNVATATRVLSPAPRQPERMAEAMCSLCPPAAGPSDSTTPHRRIMHTTTVHNL